jgi:mitochondrial cardiolipin hydrolase
VIVDKRKLLNGSYNWTRGAFSFNQENVTVSHDVALLTAFQRTFDELWQQFLS